MVTLLHKLCSWRELHLVAGIVLLAVFSSGGCAQTVFRATQLPPEFRAPPTENIEEISLSRLANYTANSQLIDRGDVLEVTIITDLTRQTPLTTPVRVSDDGMASIPLVGDVPLAGIELEDAEQAIAAAGMARNVFERPPHVAVSMKTPRTNRINVIGAVEEPGSHDLLRGSSSLLLALVAAGGLSEDASHIVEIRHRVGPAASHQLIRPPQQRGGDGSHTTLAVYESAQTAATSAGQVTYINLASAENAGEVGRYLEDGDVILVRKRAPKPIYVKGLVKEPGELELPASKDMYMLDAITKAGDRTMQIADKVLIRRQIPGREEPVVIQTSIREAMRSTDANVRLAPGDVVSVESTPATVVLDALRSFIRFGMSSSIPLF